MTTKADLTKALCTHVLSPLIPVRFRGANMNRVAPHLRGDVTACADSLMTAEPHGLYIHGGVGAGKTSILYLIQKKFALAIANKCPYLDKIDINEEGKIIPADSGAFMAERWMRDSLDMSFVTHLHLTRLLRDEVDELSFGQRSIIGSRIVFIDDFGRGYSDKAGWNMALIFEYFDWRYANNLPTFFTSNFKPEQMVKWSGWEAIADRLGDSDWLRHISVAGESKRPKGVL